MRKGFASGRRDGQQVPCAHTRSKERLVRVSPRRIGDQRRLVHANSLGKPVGAYSKLMWDEGASWLGKIAS